MDENFENNGEKNYMPVELLISFENGSFIQIASVSLEILENKIQNIQYDSQSTLMVSVNKLVEIKDLEH